MVSPSFCLAAVPSKDGLLMFSSPSVADFSSSAIAVTACKDASAGGALAGTSAAGAGVNGVSCIDEIGESSDGAAEITALGVGAGVAGGVATAAPGAGIASAGTVGSGGTGAAAGTTEGVNGELGAVGIMGGVASGAAAGLG